MYDRGVYPSLREGFRKDVPPEVRRTLAHDDLELALLGRRRLEELLSDFFSTTMIGRRVVRGGGRGFVGGTTIQKMRKSMRTVQHHEKHVRSRPTRRPAPPTTHQLHSPRERVREYDLPVVYVLQCLFVDVLVQILELAHHLLYRLHHVRSEVVPPRVVVRGIIAIGRSGIGVGGGGIGVVLGGGLRATAGEGFRAHAPQHLAVKQNSVPVVTVAGMFKLCPMYPHEGQDTLNDLISPSSVVDYRLMGDPVLSDVEFVNPVHDYIPPQLIDLYVTNIGGFQPSYIYRLLAECYHSDDWEAFE